jgi:hypothetical protein
MQPGLLERAGKSVRGCAPDYQEQLASSQAQANASAACVQVEDKVRGTDYVSGIDMAPSATPRVTAANFAEIAGTSWCGEGARRGSEIYGPGSRGGDFFYDLRHGRALAGAGTLSPMQAIAIITWAASATSLVAFFLVIWNYAERADSGS